MSNKIKLVSPFYNPSDAIERNINSVLKQKYDNFETLFIDDASDDDTWDKMEHFLNIEKKEETTGDTGHIIEVYKASYKGKTKCNNIEVWRRKGNVGALANWHDAGILFCDDPDDILVSLDGDDWLLNKKVFSHINEMYENNDIWITYGGCKWTDGRVCCSMPYNESDFNDLRKAHFKVSQMRTYRAGLYHKIKEKDPSLSSLKDKNGYFYQMACDVALMYPLLEMAGYHRVMHNKKPIYVYNRHNPINDDKKDQQLQWGVHAEVLKKPSWDRLENYK